MLTDSTQVAAALRAADTWLLPQPKAVRLAPDTQVDLSGLAGIRCPADGPDEIAAIARQLAELIADRAGVPLAVHNEPANADPAVTLSLDPTPDTPAGGYELSIGADGSPAIDLRAKDVEGLRYGIRTLAQVATDRAILPGMRIRDWPALPYRGLMQDISRGQVPKPETLHRLADVLAEAKMNVLELYIEHAFRFPSHPDIAPPEALTAEEGAALFNYAATLGIEVHPMLQVLGHSYHVLKLPQYEHLRIGPSEKAPWIMTFDIRNPEAVGLVNDLVDDVCTTFPGTFLSVDITEIDIDGLADQGVSVEEVTDLVFDYVLKLNEMVKKHDVRLLIAQGPLDSVGHLAGMGPRLDDLPKDIIIGSYYCAGGPYAPAWEKDFPRMAEMGFDFFAQAWITAHTRILPWTTDAADFSDKEVARGLMHGALGSVTCDWGDAGHVHYVGQEWYPTVYHGASAWTGAQVDRTYFNEAYTRIFFGLSDDSVGRATVLAGDINGQMVSVRDEDGAVTEQASMHFWEFFHDPFTHADIVKLADPGKMGRDVLAPAEQAVALLEEAVADAARNRDIAEQMLFGARCYEAMGRKLIAVGRYQDETVPREEVIAEMEAVIETYRGLRADFERLWLDENRDNENFRDRANWFSFTANAFTEKIAELQQAERGSE